MVASAGNMLPPLGEGAERLRAAYHGGALSTLRDVLEADDVAAAYAMQALNEDFWTKAGRTPVGYKIGLTSEAAQRHFGAAEPDFGILFWDMETSDGGPLKANLTAPRVEGEIALFVAHDIPAPPASELELMEAISTIAPAIEIVDSRIADWSISIADMIADNGCAGGFVVGPARVPLTGNDFSDCLMQLRIDGNIVAAGQDSASMNPLSAALWLARTLVVNGRFLKAGDIILTGALGPMVPIQPGNRIDLDIASLGSAGFHYEG